MDQKATVRLHISPKWSDKLVETIRSCLRSAMPRTPSLTSCRYPVPTTSSLLSSIMTRVLFLSVLSCLLQQLLRTVQAQPVTSINFSNGIPCSGSTLDLNIGGRAFPKLVADTRGNTPATCILRLSPDQVGRAVSAFVPYRFSTTPVDQTYAFDVEFTYQISGITNGIGDGLAFVIHQDPDGDDALGSGGGSLGVYGSNPIAPALVIEFDTYLNRYGLPADTIDRAIHVTIIDAAGDIFEVAEIPAIDIRNTVSNMTPIKVNIRLDGQFLQISVNDIPRLVNGQVNMDPYFTGTDVFVGFTGGTGAVADRQDILTWKMDSRTAQNGVNPPRAKEVRPPIPPTFAPRPVSPPVRIPTAAPTMKPTTIVQYAETFWQFFVRIVRDTVRVLRDTQDALATRMRGPNDR